MVPSVNEIAIPIIMAQRRSKVLLVTAVLAAVCGVALYFRFRPSTPLPVAHQGASTAGGPRRIYPQSSIEKTLPRMDSNHPLKMGAQYYPPESKRLGETGMCLVRVEIDADGVIRATQLLSATGFGRLDSACLTAVMNGRLTPATAEGKPVFFWLEIPIFWTLGEPPRRPHFGNIFLVPTIRSDYQLKIGPDNYPPESRQTHQEGDCAVHGYVRKDGTANNVSISQSAGFAALDQACIAAIQQARFLPAHANGAAIGAFVDINISWRLPTK